MLFRWYPKAIPGRDLSVVPAERAVRWKGCGLTKAETLLSHRLLELPVEQTLGLLPELVPPAEKLLSLPLHTWPQPATETCYPPVLKLNLCMVLKDRIRGFFPWNQPLQAAVLYLRKVHHVSFSYGRDGAGVQSAGVPWVCSAHALLLPGTFSLLGQRPAYTPPSAAYLLALWSFRPLHSLKHL